MQINEILKSYFGYDSFRPNQEAIIREVMQGNDCLVLMPTGGGKSLCYQVPALAMEGTAVVISPLISLMHDQVEALKANGIPAEALNSGNDVTDDLIIRRRCEAGELKLLYVSPEKLLSEIPYLFSNIKISLFAVDEAHCISQWGYDFRPSYLQIASIREMKPGIPILALTATATPEVVDDIQERLHFKEKNVFKMSFERKNLAYVVREAEDKQGEMIHILQSVGGSAIVYARSRKRTKEMAQLLSQQGITATFYHAGLDPDVKDQRQKAWQKDEVRVMCATNAFGMGIDKPDVRVVIHIDCPDSLEAYFQEAGRAGRDGQKSYAVLLYNKHDELKLCKRVDDTFPPKELIQDIYEHLAYFYQIGVGSGQGKTFEFDIEKFCVTYKYFPTKVDAALRILERSGYLHYEDNPDGKARVMFLLGRNDLYQLDQLAPSQDAVVTALLRSYGSLFVDLTYIDETMIARQAELTIQQVYFALKSLAARHIIQFIPRRKIPFISYTRDRVDGDKVVIPKEVWESRREQYEKRIKSMIRYAKNDEVCRSRQLLAYFGEENDRDCKQCDVCLADQAEEREKELRRKVAENQIIIEDHHIIEKKD